MYSNGFRRLATGAEDDDEPGSIGFVRAAVEEEDDDDDEDADDADVDSVADVGDAEEMADVPCGALNMK